MKTTFFCGGCHRDKPIAELSPTRNSPKNPRCIDCGKKVFAPKPRIGKPSQSRQEFLAKTGKI